jgi:hypothetical protein
VGEGVFTICVVLEQSTVIFKKGGRGYYNLWWSNCNNWNKNTVVIFFNCRHMSAVCK